MKVVLRSIARLLRPGGRLICIIGHGRLHSIRNETKAVNLRRLYENLLVETTPHLRLEGTKTEYVANHRRYLHSLKNTNGHNDLVRKEYVLVATKVS